MVIAEEHYSPDRTLRLIVSREDGDTTIGFNKLGTNQVYGHTHGDILVALSGLPESEAIRQYVERIMDDDEVIAVIRVNGEVQDVFLTDDPTGVLYSEYNLPEESFEFRRWSGLQVHVEPPSSLPTSQTPAPNPPKNQSGPHNDP